MAAHGPEHDLKLLTVLGCVRSLLLRPFAGSTSWVARVSVLCSCSRFWVLAAALRVGLLALHGWAGGREQAMGEIFF